MFIVFNFIFRVCRPCNSRKAAAERHVSSVTLFNSPSRLDDTHVNAEAVRKGQGDHHPIKKGVLIKDSHHVTSVCGSYGPMTVNLEMVAPPQLDMKQVGEVAFSHIQGLFSLICTEDYRDALKMRLLPQEHFKLYDYYTHNDWGNPQAVEIVDRVSQWECLANIYAAEGYFKAIIRRSNEEWFWALEWNRQLRILGGISLSRMKLFEGLPNEGWMATPQGRMRRNKPLDTTRDSLFFGEVRE